MSIISGNWKMNGSKKDLDQWFEDFLKQAKEFEKNNVIKDNPLLLICVPDLYFSYAQELAKKYNATTKTLKFVGTLNIAHDSDGEKYTSLVINKQSSEFMDDESIKYVLMNVSHIYADKQEAKTP